MGSANELRRSSLAGVTLNSRVEYEEVEIEKERQRETRKKREGTCSVSRNAKEILHRVTDAGKKRRGRESLSSWKIHVNEY